MSKRTALIRNGVVINVIMADTEYQPPPGHIAVPSETASIGNAHNGTAFIDHHVPEKPDLVGHARARYADVEFFAVKIGGHTVVVEHADHALLMRMAQRAAREPSATFSLAQPRGEQNVRLSASQIIALDDAVAAYHLARHHTYSAVLDGIRAGSITHHGQVDSPPAPDSAVAAALGSTAAMKKLKQALGAPSWPLQSQAISFYGDPRHAGWLQANAVGVVCPWPLHMGNILIQHIVIHKKCAASLTRVLNGIWDAVSHDINQIHALRYDVYDGSYNLRVKRGGTTLSCHAFAAAIDWDAADNQQHSIKHLFHDDSLLVVKFKAEGWIWGGDWSQNSIDSMHVQAARVHP